MRRNEKSENYLHITDKSERGRRALVVASQTVGVLAECRPPRRPFPFVSGQSFLFPMTVAFGILFGSFASVCSGFPPRANHHELDASSEPRREKHDEEKQLCQSLQNVRDTFKEEALASNEIKKFIVRHAPYLYVSDP